MKRDVHWQGLLRAYLAETFGSTFAWGTNDCCTFATDWVLRCTGEDVYSDFRGKYDSALSSARVLKEVAGEPTLEAAALYVTHKHAMPEVPVLLARRGDVVYRKDGSDERLGIVHLNGRNAVFLLATGWMTEPVSVCARAWRV